MYTVSWYDGCSAIGGDAAAGDIGTGVGGGYSAWTPVTRYMGNSLEIPR